MWDDFVSDVMWEDGDEYDEYVLLLLIDGGGDDGGDV